VGREARMDGMVMRFDWALRAYSDRMLDTGSDPVMQLLAMFSSVRDTRDPSELGRDDDSELKLTSRDTRDVS